MIPRIPLIGTEIMVLAFGLAILATEALPCNDGSCNQPEPPTSEPEPPTRDVPEREGRGGERDHPRLSTAQIAATCGWAEHGKFAAQFMDLATGELCAVQP